MKRAIYSFLALTLILSPYPAATGKPLETEDVEPKPEVSVSFKTTLEDTQLLSFKVEKPKEVKEEVASVPQPLEETVQSIDSTQVKVLAASAESSQPKGKKQIFELTAYTAGFESTGKRKGHPDYGVTASGAIVKEGRTAACPPSLPFGTKLYIPSLDHTYTCEDRGGAIKEGKLDIFIEDVDAANEFGRKKKVEVYVTKPQKY